VKNIIFMEEPMGGKPLSWKIKTRDKLTRKTKQGATSIVKFGCNIIISKPLFINNICVIV
jgi:hypothetical protein